MDVSLDELAQGTCSVQPYILHGILLFAAEPSEKKNCTRIVVLGLVKSAETCRLIIHPEVHVKLLCMLLWIKKVSFP